MAQLTPRGYTIPDGTDPISAGDDLLRANFTQIDAEISEQAAPPSGACTAGSAFTFGSGWNEISNLAWTAAGGAAPANPAIDLPPGLYLVNLRLNLQSLAADGYVQARAGATATYDLAGTAIAGGAAAHWHTIASLYPHAGGLLRLYLSGNADRVANAARGHVVRVSGTVLAD